MTKLNNTKKSLNVFGIVMSLECFFKGMIMGLSDIIPGISGGTVAFATGIYERLLSNIKQIDLKFIIAILNRDFKYLKNILDWKFLFSITSGMVISILLFSKMVIFVLSDSMLSFYLYALILGLVIGSIVFLIKEMQKWRALTYFIFILGAVISFFLSKISTVVSEITNSQMLFFDPLLILSGSIAITAMLLPGISGSFILLMFGQYYKVMKAISSITRQFDLLSYATLINLSLGIFLGVLFFSKTIIFLLDRYKNNTLSFLIGLMSGSIYLIWPYKNVGNLTNIISFNFVISLFLITFGIMFVLFFKKNDNNKQKVKT